MRQPELPPTDPIDTVRKNPDRKTRVEWVPSSWQVSLINTATGHVAEISGNHPAVVQVVRDTAIFYRDDIEAMPFGQAKKFLRETMKSRYNLDITWDTRNPSAEQEQDTEQEQ